MKLTLALFFATVSFSQLIPKGSPVPVGPNPPVVFVNGYQTDCSNSSFPSNFGNFDQILQRQNRAALFFNNCDFPLKPPIEDLGTSFGQFLAALKYTDGTAVTKVDVVAHSMGGLVVRSYLSGKQAVGTFTPPASTPIRKVIFLATPHGGSQNIAILLVSDNQTRELATGSQFIFDLNTWNQGTDDLRGLDALTVLGNAGTGADTAPDFPTKQAAGFDDGLVSLTSGSLSFVLSGRTRIVTACHTGPGLLTQVGYCSANSIGIAEPKLDTDPTAQIVTSFLADTATWRTVGQAAEDNSYLTAGGGISLRAKTAADVFLPIDSATGSKALFTAGKPAAWSEYLTPPAQHIVVISTGTRVEGDVSVTPGFTNSVILKTGPLVRRVIPAAARVSPLAITESSYISIYGTGLMDGTVTLGGVPLQVIANTPNQLNAITPATVTAGYTPLTVKTPSGQSTVNLLVQPVLPALFTQDGTIASALNAVTGALITTNNPLHAGDYVSLYLTGLGRSVSATVTVGGKACPVQYAGIAPGYTALDQINCIIPAGLTPGPAVPVIVTAGSFSSNTATLAIQ